MICAALFWWQLLSQTSQLGGLLAAALSFSTHVMKWDGCALKGGASRALGLCSPAPSKQPFLA